MAVTNIKEQLLHQLQDLVIWATTELQSPSMAIEADHLEYWMHEAEAVLQFPQFVGTGTFLQDLDECICELEKIRRLCV